MAELEKGRDRLIELNSCRRDVAQQLMQTIANEDAANTLPDFMERVWSAFGVEQEEQPEAHLNIIRPGNHQLLDGFPALDPEGMTVSFNRDYALAREDVHFLTWEHPMAQGVLDLFLTQEFGNANIAIIRNKGIKAGTLLVEIFFRLETIAPKGLNIDSALPSLVQRVLLDHEGRLLSDRVSHEVLVKQVQHMDKSLARQILKSQQSLIESLLQKAQKQAESQLPAVRDAALNKWQVQNQQEIDRLKALAAVNPAVRPAEIAILEKRLAEGTAALKNLKLVAHAVRLIVAG
jgi:ATP-dependent helicase HepA